MWWLLYFKHYFSDNNVQRMTKIWILCYQRNEHDIMNIGNQILNIRKEKQLTQEEFGKLFHVTRQTVSNLENEKSYPDLQMLIDISNQFEISLDTLIKEDSKMVKTIDKERVLGKIKKKNQSLNFLRVQALELL